MGQELFFWIGATALILVVGAILARAVFTRAQGDAHDGAASDLAVYKDQMAEIDRDQARGVLTATEADAVRNEVARRLLDADKRQTGTGDVFVAKGQFAGLAILALFVGAGTIWLYLTIGAPGYPDVPLEARIAAADAARADRPGQAIAETEVGQPPTGQAAPDLEVLLDRLRDAVQQRPDDLQGARLLAQNEAQQGRFIAAREAQENVIRILGDDVPLIEYIRLADLLVLAAGGYVSPEAEALLDAILQADPQNGTARYYTGLLFAQTGRPDVAFRVWRSLLEESDDTAPWAAPIRAQIFDLAQAAGVRYTPPAPRTGPTADQIAAAEELSEEERTAMIQGMVEGLAGRLATDGGPAPEWARLIQALMVLGDRDRAEQVLFEARQAFAGDARSSDEINAVAQAVGLE